MSETINSDPEVVIYTITSLYTEIHPDIDGNTLPLADMLPERERLVGIYKTIESAKRCVEEDHASFDECGYYNYIVIEGLWEGCYPGLGDHETWYRHDENSRKWVSCERPKCFGCLVNFYE